MLKADVEEKLKDILEKLVKEIGKKGFARRQNVLLSVIEKTQNANCELEMCTST